VIAENARTSYDLRSERAAWNAFVDRDPRLRARWEIYLETPIPDLVSGQDIWSLDKPKPQSLIIATTQSATQPVTRPATDATKNETNVPPNQ
jgi:hypothetical protein